jgi:DNA-binding protein HU-beta
LPLFYTLTKNTTMNKAELISKISEDTELTKTEVNAVLNSFVDTVTFSVSKRLARNGRNPKTNEMIKIKAKRVAKFKAGKELSARI